MSGFRFGPAGGCSLMAVSMFAHPPDRLMRAHLEAGLAAKWLGSDRHPMVDCVIDARPGGAFRYVWTGDSGGFSMAGRFEDITGTRIVQTEIFDPDWTGGMTRVITDFLPQDGGTLLQTQVIYASAKARDQAAASGMAEGMDGAYQRLDALL